MCKRDLGRSLCRFIIPGKRKKDLYGNPGVQPDLEGESYVIGRMLKPEARKDIIEFFAKQEIIPTSMMDISDG